MDRPAVILLVEDDEDHAMMATLAFEDLDMGYGIHWVRDGKEAMDYLHRSGRYSNQEDSPRPDLILLDLRLPVIDGHEVLKITKESCELRAIPVIILTSSQNQADIMRAYSNYANSYLVKPMNSDTLVRMIGSLGIYWLKWNLHPRENEQNQTG